MPCWKGGSLVETSRVQVVWEKLFATALIVSIPIFAVVVSTPSWASYIALVGVLGVWILSLLLRRPIWGFMEYVALIALENMGVLPLPIAGLTAIKVAGVLAVLTALAWFVIFRRSFRVPSVAIPVGALICACAVSWWLGARSSFGAQLLFTLVTVVATSWVLTNLMFSRQDFQVLLLTLALSTTGYAVIALLYAVRSGLLLTSNVNVINRLRVEWPLGDANYLALYISFGLLASISLLYLDLPRSVKRCAWLCAIAAACGIAATLSRTGMLVAGLGAGFLVLQLSGRQGRWRRLMRWGLVFGALGLSVGGTALRSRILISIHDTSVLGRLWALQAGWGMWLDSPFVGIGLGRFADLYRMYAPQSAWVYSRLVAHNSWMEILAETGLLGFIPWCGVAMAVAREWFTSSHWVSDHEGRVSRAFVGAALLALLVASFVLNVHFNKYLWLFAFLAYRIKVVFAESVAEQTDSGHDSITTFVRRIHKELSRSPWPWILRGAGLIVILAVLISLSPLPERFCLNYIATPTVIVIRQEAEEGFLAEPMREAFDIDSSSGFYVYSPEGSGDHSQGHVTFSMAIPRSGNYWLWARVREGAGSGSNSFYVSVDGPYAVEWSFSAEDWRWAPVTDEGVAISTWHLGEGEHTVTFRIRQDGAQLDVIEMFSAPYIPHYVAPWATDTPAQEMIPSNAQPSPDE